MSTVTSCSYKDLLWDEENAPNVRVIDKSEIIGFQLQLFISGCPSLFLSNGLERHYAAIWPLGSLCGSGCHNSREQPFEMCD